MMGVKLEDVGANTYKCDYLFAPGM